MTNSQYSILNGPDPAHSIAEAVWGGASLTERRSGVRAGHRRYHSIELRKELMALKADIWNTCRRVKVGLPTDDDFTRTCNGESPSASC
jgi:hypothetical protein